MSPRRHCERRQAIALLVMIALAGVPRVAHAYCRRSTCAGVAAMVCTPAQADDCGIPVRWPERPLVYELARSDEPLRRAGAAAIDRAFARWRDADCGGGRHPDLTIAVETGAGVAGGASRGTIEFSDDWPKRGGGTLAVTQLFFAPDSGRMLRARVIFYTTQLQPYGPGAFLDAIAVHEIGHLLGLAHSANRSAVMSEEVHDGTAARVELAGDDVAGICAIYPPRHAPGAAWRTLLGAIAESAVVAALLVAGLLYASRPALRSP